MSSFNNVEKISYNKVNEDPVSLVEYIVFSDDTHKEKYAILKLRNNLNQILSSVKINVYQFDENRVLLEKSLLVYGNFQAGSQEIFVPNAKLPLNYNTKSIEVNLEFAKFERLVWQNNDLNIVPYTRKEFKQEFTSENEKVKQAIIKEEKQNKGKRKIQVRDVIKANVPRGPIRFARIFTILLFAFVIFGAITSKNFTFNFSYNDFDYKKTGNELTILKYTGDDESVVIPRKVSGMPIVSIASGAFEESSIESIQFNARNLEIESGAFKNCVYLENIYDNNSIDSIGIGAFENCYALKTLSLPVCTYIDSSAFKNCYSLNYVDASNAILAENSFIGCGNISSFYYGSSNSQKFLNMFSTSLNVSRYPMDVVTNQLRINKGFFEGCYGFSQLKFTNESFNTEAKALADLNLSTYISVANDDVEYEKYNGNIISFYIKGKSLTLDDQFSTQDINAILASANCYSIKELKVDTANVPFDDSLISRFTNLTKLELTDKVDVKVSDYSIFPSTMTEMIIDTNVSKFADLVGGFSATQNPNYGASTVLRVKGSKGIDGLMLQKATTIKSIIIEDSVPSIAENAFTNCVNMRELVIPTLGGYTLRQLGINTTLTHLTVTKIGNFASGVFNGYNFTYLEINLGSNQQTMQNLFGGPASVNTLVVSANTINDYFLTKMRVNTFAIKSTNMIYAEFAADITNKISNLYICDNVTVDLIKYDELSKTALNVSFGGDGTYAPGCNCRYGIEFEQFIKNYK